MKYERTNERRVTRGVEVCRVRGADGSWGGWVADGVDMTRFDGVFHDGVFHGGEFRGGVFHGGVFHGGVFRGGEFRGGVFRGGVFHDGVFRGGEFRGGVFHDGVFHDGVFRDTPPAATRSDGYLFVAIHDPDGTTRVSAGCRRFTFADAREHWIATRGGTRLGEESLAILDHLERMVHIAQS